MGTAADKLAGVHGQALKIKIAAPAQKGQANAALSAFLAKILDLPKSQVILVGLTMEEVKKRLGLG